jgi:hypothetical protein
MNQPIETFKVGNKTVNIFQDEDSESPRTSMDNLGKMICFHRRYNLGDKHDYKSSDYNSYAEMEKAIKKEENAAVILPLYLFDHSGITMRTTSFNDNWDSGQVGFIVVSKEKVREEYSVKRINKKLLEKVTAYLVGEVETYDQYLRGDIYGFKIEDSEENEIDSSWGYYGIESVKQVAKQEAEHIIKAEMA